MIEKLLKLISKKQITYSKSEVVCETYVPSGKFWYGIKLGKVWAPGLPDKWLSKEDACSIASMFPFATGIEPTIIEVEEVILI